MRRHSWRSAVTLGRPIQIPTLTLVAVVAAALVALQTLCGSHALAQEAPTGLVDAYERDGLAGLRDALVRGAPPDQTNAAGDTSLHVAAAKGDADAVALLLAEGASTATGDRARRTPLHIAALGGHADIATLLLDAGASASAIDADGNTPRQLAVDRAQPRVVEAIVAAAKPTAPRGAMRPAPGADLLRLTSLAKDGDVIELTAGTYQGPIVARGITLTIIGDAGGNTIIQGDNSPNRPVILATQGASLTVTDMTVKTGHATQIGAAALEAKLRVVGGTFEAMPTYACYAQKGELRVEASRFAKLDHVAVALFNESIGIVADSTFERCRNHAVYVEPKGSVLVRGSTFDSTGGRPVLGAKGSTVHVRDCVIERCAASAVRAEQAAQLAVVNTKMIGATHGIEAVGVTGRTVVRGCTIEKLPAESANGVFITDPASTLIAGNAIRDGKTAVLITGRPIGSVVISDNVLARQTAGGVYVQAPADAKATLAIARNLVVGPGRFGVALRDRTRAELSHNSIVANETAVGLSVEKDASAALRADTIVAGKAINVFEADPNNVSLNGDLIIGPIASERGEVERDGQTQRIDSVMTGTGGRTVVDLAAALLVANEGMREGDPQAFARTRASLDAATKQIREQAVSLTAVAFVVEDASGRTGFVPFAVYRAAQDDDTQAGDAAPLAEVTTDKPVMLPPGTYRFVSMQSNDVAATLTVEASAATQVVAKVDGAVWLHFAAERGHGETRVLVPLRPATDMQRIIGQLRRPVWSWRRFGVARPDVPAGVRRDAINLARDTFARFEADTAVLPAAVGADEASTLSPAERHALRILATIGDTSDASLIARHRPGASAATVLELASAVAAIEARHGVLGRGVLVDRISAGEPTWSVAAAIMLRHHGMRVADDMLRNCMARPRSQTLAVEAAWVLLGSNDPATLSAMRDLWRAANDNSGDASQSQRVRRALPAALYLLAYGTPEDRAAVGDADLASAHALAAAHLSTAPGSLLQLASERVYMDELLDAGAAFVDAPADARSAWRDYLVALAADREAPRHVKVSGAVRERAHGQALVHASAFDPASEAATTLATDNGRKTLHFADMLADLPWIDAPAIALERFSAWRDTRAAFNRDDELLFARIASDDLAARFPTRDDSADEQSRALFLAAHRVSRSARRDARLTIDHGATIVPFGYVGASAGADEPGEDAAPDVASLGVLHARAWWVNDQLRIGVAVRGVATTDAPTATQPMTSGIVRRVHVREGADALLAAEVARESGGVRVFEVAPSARGFAGLIADVEVETAGGVMTLSWPLYDCSSSRRQRATEAGVQAALQAATREPASLDTRLALARAHAAAGEITLAENALRQAVAAKRDDTSLWLEAAALRQSHGMHQQASELLLEAVRANPGSLELWRALTRGMMLARNYGLAAGSAQRALVLAKNDTALREYWAASLMLQGRSSQAVSVLAAVPDASATPNVLMLRFVAAVEANADRASVAAAFNRWFDKAPPGVSRDTIGVLFGRVDADAAVAAYADDHAARCRTAFAAGYRHLAHGEVDAARARFEQAVATLQQEEIAWHLARYFKDRQ